MNDLLAKYMGNGRGWSYKFAEYNVRLTDQINSIIKDASNKIYDYMIRSQQESEYGTENTEYRYNGVFTTYKDKSFDVVIELRSDVNVECFAYYDWKHERIITFPLYLFNQISINYPETLNHKDSVLLAIKGILEHEFVHFVDPRAHKDDDDKKNEMEKDTWVPDGDNFETEVEFNAYCKNIVDDIKDWIGNDDQSEKKKTDLIFWLRSGNLKKYPDSLRSYLVIYDKIFNAWENNALCIRRFFLTVYGEVFQSKEGISATAIAYMKKYSTSFESFGTLRIPKE